MEPSHHQHHDQIELARGVTIAKYKLWEAGRERDRISDFIHRRFSERYLRPAMSPGRHGFAMMAIGCLMIEALESFYQGWSDTRRMSYKPFALFFGRNKEFDVFQPLAEDFYRNVRCGILHQAETKNGWRIKRIGPMYEATNQTINATLFLRELIAALERYRNSLATSAWESDIWVQFTNKMAYVCKNAERSGGC